MTRHSAATSVRISDCSKTSFHSTATSQTDGVATIQTIPSLSKYGMSQLQQQQQQQTEHHLKHKHQYSRDNTQNQPRPSSYDSTVRHSYSSYNDENATSNEDEYENNNMNDHANNVEEETHDSKQTSDNEYDSNEEDDDEDDEDDEDLRNRSTCAILAGNGIKGLNTSNSSTCSISNNNNNGTIALFGIYSRTGNHFLRLALDAGYSVRVFLLPSASIIDPNGNKKIKKTITSVAIQDEFSNTDETLLKWISAKRFDDKHAIQRTIKNVDYVVCMLSDTVYTDTDTSSVITSAQKRRSRASSSGGGSALGRNSVGSTSKPNNATTNTNSKGGKAGILTNFVQTLYPLMMKMPTIQVFLYQATSLANNTINGSTPILSHLFKAVAQVAAGSKTSSFLYDQDMVMNEISFQHYYSTNHHNQSTTTTDSTKNKTISSGTKIENQENYNTSINNADEKTQPSCQPHFSYIVTRPTSLINDGPSSKKLVSTKSVRSQQDIENFLLDVATLNHLSFVSPFLFVFCCKFLYLCPVPIYQSIMILVVSLYKCSNPDHSRLLMSI
jgi:hypothetical protein